LSVFISEFISYISGGHSVRKFGFLVAMIGSPISYGGTSCSGGFSDGIYYISSGTDFFRGDTVRVQGVGVVTDGELGECIEGKKEKIYIDYFKNSFHRFIFER
jgi:hypothetical protein